MVDLLHSVGQQLLSFLPLFPLRSLYDTYLGKTEPEISIRRVVTGHNSEGLGTLVWDGEIVGQVMHIFISIARIDTTSSDLKEQQRSRRRRLTWWHTMGD